MKLLKRCVWFLFGLKDVMVYAYKGSVQEVIADYELKAWHILLIKLLFLPLTAVCMFKQIPKIWKASKLFQDKEALD